MQIDTVLKSLAALLLASTMLACSSDDDDNRDTDKNNAGNNVNANSTSTLTGDIPEVKRLEFPKLKQGTNIIIVHKTADSYDPQGVNYCTEWDYTLQSQRWSCYQMHSGYKVTGVSRYYGNPQYPWDEDLATDYFVKTDYFVGSGFDHGHICPSADRLYSKTANYQTFFMTNMQPQYNKFNAGLWGVMEEQVRKWTPTKSGDTLYVCKGTTIDGQYFENKSGTLKYIQDKQLVPRFFYMALLLRNELGFRAIAFWAENLNEVHTNDPLINYVISIDELEKRTGIDFFCNLPDDIEEQVEASYVPIVWGLNGTPQ